MDEQEHKSTISRQNKAVQVWSWGNMYLPKPGKWPSQHLYLKISIGKSIGFHARKNPKHQYLKVVTLSDASYSKNHIYVYDHAA